MAVAFDSVGPGAAGANSNGAASPLAWTHNISASATMLFVVVGQGNDASTTTVTAGGVTMTTNAADTNWKRHTADGTAGYMQVFVLPAPPTGSSVSISVSWTGGGTAAVTAGSISFTGSALDSTGYRSLSATAAGTSASPLTAGSFSTLASSMILGAFAWGGGSGTAFTANSPATLRESVVNTATGSSSNAITTAAGNGTTSMGGTISSDSWAATAFEVLAAASGGIATWPSFPTKSRRQHHHGVYRTQIQQVFAASSATNVTAGLASASGTAFGPVPEIDTQATVATATGTAFGPVPEIDTQATVATATGTAYGPVPEIDAQPTVAAATGTAFGPVPEIDTQPTVATATGAAFNAQVVLPLFTHADSASVQATSGVTTISATLAGAVSQGDLLVLGTGCPAPLAAGDVTDSAGNTWTVAESTTFGGIAYCLSSAAAPSGLTVTVAHSGSSGTRALAVDRFTVASGYHAIFGAAEGSSTGIGSTSFNLGALSGVPAGELLWGYLHTDTGSLTFTPGSSNSIAAVIGTQTSNGSGSIFTEDVTSGAGGTESLTATASAAPSISPNYGMATFTAAGASGIATWPSFPTKSRLQHHHGVYRQQVQQVFAASSATNVTAGLASASGTAYGPAPEIDTQPSIATATGTAYGPVPEIDTQPTAATATGTAYGPVPEIDAQSAVAAATGTAQNPVAAIAVTAGLASGTGSALSPPPSITVFPGAATATGTAYSPVPEIDTQPTAATATGTAYSPVPEIDTQPTVAPAVGTAFDVPFTTPTFTPQQVVRRDWHRAYRRRQMYYVPPAGADATVTAGLASATGTAFSPVPEVDAQATIATATGTSFGPVPEVDAQATIATATGTAFNPVAQVTALPAVATATGTAFSPVAEVDTQPTLAAGTGTAPQPVAEIDTQPTVASAVGTAFDVSFSPPSFSPQLTVHREWRHQYKRRQLDQFLAVSNEVDATVTAGVASATGTAFSPVAEVDAQPTLAAGTGTAFSPVAQVTAFPAVASATGTAQQPTAQVTVTAGLASATGAAFNTALITIAAQPGLASGTATAQQPAAAITVFAGLAAATGTAFTAAPGRVPGLAAGTGTANSPAAALTVFAGLASATGTAPGATGVGFVASVKGSSRASVSENSSTSYSVTEAANARQSVTESASTTGSATEAASTRPTVTNPASSQGGVT